MSGATAAAIGVGIQAIAGYQAGQYNAAVSLEQQRVERGRGLIAGRMARSEAAYAKQSAEAAVGASGVAMEGSPLDAIATSMANARVDEMRIEQDSELRVGYLGAQAQQQQMAGTYALLGGAAQAYGAAGS